MPFVVGEQVGPYRIVEQLGQGGMSTVYKAYHAALDRYVALKVLHPVFKGDQDFLARFQREARIVARLEHPHIVPVYDFSEHEGTPYLVMRYIEGCTLKGLLAEEPAPSLERIVEILTPVCDALEYAHGQGVLHRDVKPSNILLSREGKVYVTDFGLAKMAQTGDSTISQDRMIGTPQYISPEQAKGETLDHRTDLYSLGVVLFEMLAGRVPYTADTPFAVVHDHIFSPLPLPSSLNPAIAPAIEKVVLKALAKSPADRYQSAGEFLRALAAAVQELRQAQAVVPPPAPAPAEAAAAGLTPVPLPLPAETAAASILAPVPLPAEAAPAGVIPGPVPVQAAEAPAGAVPLPVEATVPLVAPEVPPALAPGESAAATRKPGRRPRRWAAWVGGALGLLVVTAAALLLILRPWAQEPGQQQAQQTEKPTPQKQEKPPFPFRMSEAYPRAGEPLTLEQAQRAVNELKPRLEQEPKNAMLRLQLGNAFYDLQEWERAAVAYKDALALDPNMAIAHYNLGNTLVYLARPKEAVPHYEKVIDLRLDAAEGAIFNMGFAHAIVGNYPEAIAALERFKEIHRQEDIWRERAGGMLEWLRKQP